MRQGMLAGGGWTMWLRRISVAALLALGVFTTCYRITAPAMWLDEVYHREAGFEPVRSIVRQEFFMQFCVGYYLINRWTEALLGGPERGVRMPQAAAAIITLLVAYLLGRHAYSTGAGLLAMFWLAISPVFVRYAQENRFYQMGSMAALTTYYFFVRYVETRQWRYVAGLIAGSVLLMHTYTYGFVFAGMVVPLAGFLLVLQWMMGRERAPYALERGVVIGLAIWGAVVVALWAPLGLRVVSWLMSGDLVGVSGAKQGKATFDSWWTEPFGVTPQALAAFVKEQFVSNAYVYAHPVRYGVLLAAGVAGAVALRRGRMAVCVLFFYLTTLGLVHVSNMTQAVVMAKRFLYMYPVSIVLLSGGLACMAAVALRAGRAVVWWLQARGVRAGQSVRVTWLVVMRALVWLVLVRYFVLGPAGAALYQLTQYYYTERAPYKTLSHVLTTHVRLAEPIFWHPAWNDGWLLQPYVPRELLRQRVDTDGQNMTRAQLWAAVAKHGGAWLHDITPARLGVPAEACVHVPVQGRTLWLVRAAYSNDPAQRAADQEALLRTVVERAANPETRAAEQLTQHLLGRGATNAADDVAEQMARFCWSQDVAEWLLAYASNRCDYARGHQHWYAFADRMFWVPEHQARAVQYALDDGATARARKFARRYGRWSGDRARAAQWMAESYHADSNYAAADAWLARARRMTRSGYQHEELRRLQQRWQRERHFEPALDAWCAAWTQTLALVMLDDWYEMLDETRARPALWQRLAQYAAARGMTAPSVLPDRSAPGQTGAAVDAHAFTAGVSVVMWPIYAYLVDRCMPTNVAGALLIGWRDLPAHGMPGPAQMSDGALVWFERWYRGRLPHEEMAAFYCAAATRSAARGAWAVQRVRAIGMTNTVSDIQRALAAEMVMAPLRAALRRWRTVPVMQELPEIVYEMETALSSTAHHARAQAIIEEELGQRPQMQPARSWLRRLRRTVTHATWPVYVLALQQIAAHTRHPDWCVPPGQLEKIGFAPVAEMSAGTLLWFDAFYQRYGSSEQREAWYELIMTGAPARRAWAASRHAALDSHRQTTNIHNNTQP